MNMKLLLCFTAVTLATAAHAQVVYTSGALNLGIPDDTSAGIASTLNVMESEVVTSVSLALNLSVPAGDYGWFGDLYGYLQHDSGLAVLINRPGRTAANPTGYDDGQAVTITFSDAAANGDLHGYRTTLYGDESTPLAGPLTGAWQPDGRATDPALTLDTDARTALLGQFNGGSMVGNWTLFLADLSGGGQYRLDSWSLTLNDISPVPEPAALGVVLGAALVGFAAWHRHGRRTAQV